MTKRNEELERRLSRHGFRYTVDKSGDCYEYNRRGREGSWYGAVQITALEYDGLCAPRVRHDAGDSDRELAERHDPPDRLQGGPCWRVG